MTEINQSIQSNYEVLNQDADRIYKKLKSTKKNIVDKIDQVIEVLTQTKQSLQEHKNESQEYVQQTILNVQQNLKDLKPIKNICNNHKECFNYISKMGKNMDKLFIKQQGITNHVDFDEQSVLLIIQDHFMREGQFDLYDVLSKESNIISDLNVLQYFKNVRQLSECIKEHNLIPVIEWSQCKKDQLKTLGSPLLFQLYKQHFVHLVKSAGREQAIQFARQNDNFKNFSNTNLFDIQQLMTSLLFLDKLEGSKYETIYDEQNWVSLKEMFVKDSLKIRGQLVDSALKTTYTAGTYALPKLMKYYQIAEDKKMSNKNEIPIDIEIGKEFKFHSFFVCPVSREICYPDNPPMLLKCRHVVSQHSILKMTTNPTRNKFKCPTCPMEQKPSEVRKLDFL